MHYQHGDEQAFSLRHDGNFATADGYSHRA
jgi:hypothetical protein